MAKKKATKKKVSKKTKKKAPPVGDRPKSRSKPVEPIPPQVASPISGEARKMRRAVPGANLDPKNPPIKSLAWRKAQDAKKKTPAVDTNKLVAVAKDSLKRAEEGLRGGQPIVARKLLKSAQDAAKASGKFKAAARADAAFNALYAGDRAGALVHLKSALAALR